jgi:hypothetical protein
MFTDTPSVSPLNFGLLWGVLFGYYFTVSFGDAVVEGVHVVANEEGLVEAKTMEHVGKMLQGGQRVLPQTNKARVASRSTPGSS